MNKMAPDENKKANTEIFKFIWKIPHNSIDDTERLKLTKLTEKEKSFFIPFR